MKKLIVLLFLISSFVTNSQIIKGKISDSLTGESLFGALASIGSGRGSVSDFDGNFTIKADPGRYNLEVKYTGYYSQTIELKVKDTVFLDLKLTPITKTFKDITITGVSTKGTVNELLKLQTNSAVVMDGTSSESIKKTPDAKASDVIKRISGASVLDGKFIVIRGLTDRYNFAQINGCSLPSSEPDKRAFSFDIFPSNMLDGIVVSKTALPELPGDFSGGVLNIKTIEPGDKNGQSFNFSSGVNSLSTFQPFLKSSNNSIDYLGFGSYDRRLPNGLPSTEEFSHLNKNEKANLAKLMNFNWTYNKITALPNMNIGMSLNRKWKDLRFVFAFNWSNTYNFNNSKRSEFEEQSDGVVLKMELNDKVYTHNVIGTSMFNLVWNINDKNTIKFKNMYSVNSEDRVNDRTGVREMDNNPHQFEKSTNFWYTQNNLLTSQINGTHQTSSSSELQWNFGFSDVRRDIPNLRRVVYRKNSLLEGDTSVDYSAVIQSNGTIPTACGNMFWSKSNEKIINLNYDWTKKGEGDFIKVDFKFGLWHGLRLRQFDSRNFGFSQYKPTGSSFNYGLLNLGPNQIFSESNLGLLSNGQGGFKLDESTKVDDSYGASSFINAMFFQLDTKIGKKIRAVGGLRLESWTQNLNYTEFGSNLERKIDTTIVDPLPSINLIYSPIEKMKVRASYSRTLSRPEFREIAPFNFYNFILDNIISGNTNLKRALIDNWDLRWEFTPQTGQLISVSGFWKNFQNPIELINRTGTSGSPELYYSNVSGVKNIGMEFELRIKLSSIIKVGVFDNISLYSNLSIINSKVNLDNFIGSGGTRPLQGQSPFIINSALNWDFPGVDMSFNLSYNYVAQRIYIVGNVQEPSVWEGGRNVIDLQLSKKFRKNIELKLNVKDILAQNLIYFQDLNGNKKFDSGVDNTWQKINFSQTITTSIKWSL